MSGQKNPERRGPLSRVIKIWIAQPGTATFAVVLFLALAAFPAALIFDRASAFNNNDPNSAGQEAQDLHGLLTGGRLDPEVILLAEPDTESTPAEVASELRELDGVAAVSRTRLNNNAGVALLATLTREAGSDRSSVGSEAESLASKHPGYTATGIAVASHRLERQSERETRIIEFAAAPILFLLLLIVFRGFTAALLPLLVGGSAILLTFASLSLLTDLRQVDVFSLQTVTALGTGLAIDYSLFIVARYRQERQSLDPEEAMHVTYSTAGRTVVFSSATIAVAVLSLMVFPSPFLRSSGLGAALVAAFAGISAIVALPPVMMRMDARIIKGSVKSGLATQASDPIQRLIGASVARPVLLPLAGLLAVLALTVPVINIDLTIPDAQVLGSDDPARVAGEVVAEESGFPANTLTVVTPGSETKALRKTSRMVAGLPGVSSVGPPESIQGGSSRIRVSGTADPLSDQGQDLVDAVRGAAWPSGTLVGGRATELADQEQSVEEHLPAVVAILLLATTLLLYLLTRSLRISMLAITVNALTVGASLGVLTLIFQSDTMGSILGFDNLNAVDITVPLLTSTAIFGLSTDYGIFVLSRVNEAGGAGHVAGRDLINALSASTRLVSAAAIVFAVALGAFIFSDLIFVKQISVALVSAVLIDAFVIRPLIIPGVLQLFAERGPSLPRPPGWQP